MGIIMSKKHIVIISCFIFIFFICNSVFARNFDADYKHCFDFRKVFTSAIKDYNKNNKINLINNLDDGTVNLLIEKGYLKNIKKPDKCQYRNMGELLKLGIIYCVYHGDDEHLVSCEYFSEEKYEKFPQNTSNEEYKNNLSRLIKEREFENKNKGKKIIEKKIIENKIDRKKLIKYLRIFLIVALIICFIDYFIKIKKMIREKKSLRGGNNHKNKDKSAFSIILQILFFIFFAGFLWYVSVLLYIVFFIE